jgi:hypothetical protein
MTFYNPVIDMSSIRTNDDGDFVFDILDIKEDSVLKIGNTIVSYKVNRDSLVDWYSTKLKMSKERSKELLDDFHEIGREAWIEKHKSPDKEWCSFDFPPASDMVWRLKLFGDLFKIEDYSKILY